MGEGNCIKNYIVCVYAMSDCVEGLGLGFKRGGREQLG